MASVTDPIAERLTSAANAVSHDPPREIARFREIATYRALTPDMQNGPTISATSTQDVQEPEKAGDTSSAMPRTAVAASAIAIAATLTAVAPAETRTCGVGCDMSMLRRAGVFDLRVENVRCAAAAASSSTRSTRTASGGAKWPSAIVEPTKPRVWRVSHRHEGGASGWTRISLRQRRGETLVQFNMYDAGG